MKNFTVPEVVALDDLCEGVYANSGNGGNGGNGGGGGDYGTTIPCSAKFSALDSGGYSVIDFFMSSVDTKKYSQIIIYVNISAGTYSNTLDFSATHARTNLGDKTGGVSSWDFISTGGNSFQMTLNLNVFEQAQEIGVKVETLWNHLEVPADKLLNRDYSTYGGFDGITNSTIGADRTLIGVAPGSSVTAVAIPR